MEAQVTADGVDGRTNEALAADLVRLRNSLNTPETVGRALANFVLTETITRGTQVDATTFELPIVVTTKIERREINDPTTVTTTICYHHHITVFGHEIIGWDSCTTTVTTTEPTPPG